MRTDIEIDDKLMEDLQEIAKELDRDDLKTKRAIVDAALRELRQQLARKLFLKGAGTIEWEGDLEEMRRSKLDRAGLDSWFDEPKRQAA